MIREILPPDTALAFAAMKELRPQLVDASAFAQYVDDVLRPEGYRLAGVFEEDGSTVPAVAGFRIAHGIYRGRHLYVDDLSTVPEARRRGYGRALLDWLTEVARAERCATFHLDSGVGADRADAHRLYFNAGLRIASFHFETKLL
jgi:GNAT superfamily N-acetyltransferase